MDSPIVFSRAPVSEGARTAGGRRFSRRLLLGAPAGMSIAAALHRGSAAVRPAWCYPLAFPGQIPGEGLFIKHGYACEHLAYYPGLLHTGENWYGIDRNAIEADVIAASDGVVVYADFDYPGRVVIIRHDVGLYSMYGHLDYELSVEVGQRVLIGDRIGRPLSFPDGIERTHLHFEIRTFFVSDLINGDHPSHGFTCGFQCPPGPGYWPMNAPEHPSELGWLNPTHVIQNRMFDGRVPDGAQVIANSSFQREVWSEPTNHAGAELSGTLTVGPGDRFLLVSIATGQEASVETSATGYRLWYRIETAEFGAVWIEAAVPSSDNLGADGRPSAAVLDLVPAFS